MTASLLGPAPQEFSPRLQQVLKVAVHEFNVIPGDRKVSLGKLAGYVRQQLDRAQAAKLTFICTHNSRRSHLSQVWASVSARYYGLQGVETFSGGTEATAFNPRAIAALARSGFIITAIDASVPNPHYEVRSSINGKPVICFSKVYDAPPNPSHGYCAVMTCTQADTACPVVKGCDLRIPIPYDDPKIADNTDRESVRYDERSAQICREMLLAMSLV